MTPDEANSLRLVAAEVIYRLWSEGQTAQLELLLSQCRASLGSPKGDPQ